MNKVYQICKVCGLGLPHTDPRAIAYHKEQVKANRNAIKRIRQEQQSKSK